MLRLHKTVATPMALLLALAAPWQMWRARPDLLTDLRCVPPPPVRLQAALPLAVQTLIAVASASSRTIAVWILQALLGLAACAGLAFVPHVKPTLALAQVRRALWGAGRWPGGDQRPPAEPAWAAQPKPIDPRFNPGNNQKNPNFPLFN